MNPRFRFEMAGGVYHVTNRGVDRRDIVSDDVERQKWLYCLGDAATRYRDNSQAWLSCSTRIA